MWALITGGGGQLASDLQALLGERAQSFTHEQLDITDRDAVQRALAETAPEVIFNCAAYHNLDACELDPRRAFQVNVEAVRTLAASGVKLVHISTNYVFDGARARPYGEHDLPGPRSIYAITKLAGEHAALAYGREVLIVRTAGLYGLRGSASKGGNFVQRMVARARSGANLAVVADQLLQPTYTADLAVALVDAVERGAEGIVHLTSSGSCSWHEFSCAIVEIAGLDVAITKTRTRRTPGAVERPLNGVLARPRADRLGLPCLPPWRDALERYMAAAGLDSRATAA